MGSRIAVLRDGKLMQIDTPQNLYQYPANLFVAGFIGSPSMNLFDVTLVNEDGNLYADAGVFRIKTPGKYKESWSNFAGKRAVLGVRPEDIHDANFIPGGITPCECQAAVDVVELMGNEIVLYLKSGEIEYLARVDPRSAARVGDQITPVINTENVHLFDGDTQQAIR